MDAFSIKKKICLRDYFKTFPKLQTSDYIAVPLKKLCLSKNTSELVCFGGLSLLTCAHYLFVKYGCVNVVHVP